MSKTLWLPDIGDEITLASDWTFRLHWERRNTDLLEALEVIERPEFAELKAAMEEIKEDRFHGRLGNETLASLVTWNFYFLRDLPVQKVIDEGAPVTLPAGTRLKIDRVYIRKGAKEFSSLSFFVTDSPMEKLKPKKRKGFKGGKKRFWAKLEDCRKIQAEIMEPA